MAVKIRLARHGAKKRPYYRVVVADSRMPRDGRYIEQVGRYNPLTNPKVIDINLEKVDEWISKGAQPTNAVSHLIDVARSGEVITEKKAKKLVKRMQRAREMFYKRYSAGKWTLHSEKDVVVNRARFGRQGCVDILAAAYRTKVAAVERAKHATE